MSDHLIAICVLISIVYAIIGTAIAFFIEDDARFDHAPLPTITVITRGILWLPFLIRDVAREAWRIFREE